MALSHRPEAISISHKSRRRLFTFRKFNFSGSQHFFFFSPPFIVAMLAGGDAKIALNTGLGRNGPPPSDAAIQPPFEILQIIFLFLVDHFLARKESVQEAFHSSGRPDWIAITYVCRTWRSVALSQPELWSSITPNLSIFWSQAMVERSAPLSMRIDMEVGASVGGFELLAALELLLTSGLRTRTLRLSGLRHDILSILNRFSGPSPLEALDLCILYPGPVDLPVALLGGKAPHLRYLKFETLAHIRPPGWLLAGITHFTTGERLPLRSLLSALQAMPQLEVLCLEDVDAAGHNIDSPGHVPPPRVTLPHLSLLSIRDDHSPNDFITIPSLIDAPPTLRRHFFWYKEVILSWEEWASVFKAIQALIPGNSALGVNDGGLRVANVMGQHRLHCIEVWSRTYSEGASTAAREDALFLFGVSWSQSAHSEGGQTLHHSPSFRLASLCAHLGTAHIEDLTIAPEMAIEGERTTSAPDVAAQWQALLAALPSVKTLRLHGGSPTCVLVLRALSASAQPFLPHLQRVFVFHSAVRTAAPAGPDATGVYGAGSSFASRKFVQAGVGVELVEAVSGRSGLEVVLAGCEVDEEALQALQTRARVYIGHERVYA
ncbi:hypothetical protein EDB83DRAFT_449810 [Lactarius deliciosus]|nr:hypothetical protein EDB83DRAFT_449810 [Lactarius deliciosus]